METGISRIRILGVPIDVIPEENLQSVIESLYDVNDHRQIILLGFHDFMRIRHSLTKMAMLEEAALVIPVSSLITNAARFLKKEVPPLYRPYPFIIRLLGILELRNKTIYLLGLDMKGVRKSEARLRTTFPNMRIVGRYSARFKRNREEDVLTAIKKASPTLLLTGKGLRGRQNWISQNRHRFSPGLSIWEKHCFSVFAGQRHKPSYSRKALLLSGVFNVLIRPWRLLRIFRYLYFHLLLVWTRIKQKP